MISHPYKFIRLRSALNLVQVRLRLPIVLVVAAIVVGQWEMIRNYWGRLTRFIPAESIALRAISNDTEYFCPMDPGIISDWPSKCGICNMVLVRRKRGESVVLPEGVVARMQLSPYRIQLAGIQTAPASFRPLQREWESAGIVTLDRGARNVVVEIPARQASWIAVGQEAELFFPDLPGHGAVGGRVGAATTATVGGWDFFRATIACGDSPNEVKSGMMALVRVKAPVSGMEPFRSLPAEPPAIKPAEARQVYVCQDHPASIGLAAGQCPIDKIPRDAFPLAEHQRLRWWCPMHPEITADQPNGHCRACGGMELAPRVVSFRPRGQVLAVPRSAVVDGGAKKVVFVESMPGMFDGVEVILGLRCGDYYPVVHGLEAGQKIAVAGAFLLDAETRLNPSLASAYFGASRGEHHSAASPSVMPRTSDVGADALSGLSPDDRAVAVRQKVCPVTSKPLGSMGSPARATASGKVVFLCCDGCVGAFNREPAKYLAKLPEN